MTMPRYPGMQQITFNELAEFLHRLVEQMDELEFPPRYSYVEQCAVTVYNEMIRDNDLGISGIPAPEWVKLIPADSIPVFCFAPETIDRDLAHYAEELFEFFGSRKVLVIRGDVDIYAIADRDPDPAMLYCGVTGKACERTDCIGMRCMLAEAQRSTCICGGEPHVSHCPACTEPFLKGLI